MRNGSAQTGPAHGMGTSSCSAIQRSPRTLTKGAWLERTGSRSMPAAAILLPRRRPGHLVAAHDEWACGSERRHEQPEEDPTRCQARPDRAVHDAMLPLAVGQITPANGTQRATAHPSPGREESPDQEHRNVPPSWTREQRPERRQACDHVCREEQQGTTSWLKWSSAYSSPLLSAQWTQSSSGLMANSPSFPTGQELFQSRACLKSRPVNHAAACPAWAAKLRGGASPGT